jgi:hypothetical protein
MADDTNVATTPIPAAVVARSAPDVGPLPISLDEFCTRLSATDARVEMIGAFHNGERQVGKSMDLETAFAARYAAFCNAPA